MANMSFIEQYNKLFSLIEKAGNDTDMTNLYPTIKKFVTDYESVDKTATDRIYTKFADKMQGMLEENDFVYQRMNNKVEEIRNRQYDFAGETDTTQAVQSKVLQLMAELPKTKTTSNANQIINKLNATIATGVIGSKAVLELLKYPAYIDMITETVKQHAFAGSKTPAQQAFDNLKDSELNEATKALTSVYMQGFHLRKLNEKVSKSKTIMAW
ncbi:MAG: hypothetical protein RR012_08460 [Oscillospiraceae bacterium]